ncbi:MAG TPA: adenylate/guanylate cyclase domain-containing protein [Steroidobacteraceae bacterium]|nr:adenylate/guanylate cyclase domain-containing protein [Steroidobacteraceae bacterium]
MSAPNFRTLLVRAGPASRLLLSRLIEASDIVIDEVVGPEDVLGTITLRVPDLIVVDVDNDLTALTSVCSIVKANPATGFVPLLAIARSARARRVAFDAGVDDFLLHHVRRAEFLVRVRALLRVSAARRQLAAEQLAIEVAHREQIRAAFRRYISPKLADQILANPDLRDAMVTGRQIRAHAAVLFADMRGFTGLSEQLQPNEVVELLNEFFSLLTSITFEYDGTVFNMAGDSLMVGFGVPIEQSDGAVRAIYAARRMLESFNELAQRWRDRHGIETGLGIGINVGEVIAGNVGSPSYMSYTIIGDTVNVASRLGQRARAGEMLFSDAVRKSLEDGGIYLGAMSLPALVLRGRTQPIDIYCVPSEQRIDFRPPH